MDHRNQMKKELSCREYLLQNYPAVNEGPVIYSLETEFAKTKKNRDYKPLLVFWGFILLLVAVTFGTVRFLERQSRQINIDISDFEDLRLKEALSEAKEVSSDLEVYRYALRGFLEHRKAAGCVLDPTQDSDILVFLTQKIDSETVVDLYRGDGVYVGKIRLTLVDNRVAAEAVEVAKGKKIEPLDWFRLR